MKENKHENNISLRIGGLEIGITSADMGTRECAALLLSILEWLLTNPLIVKDLQKIRDEGVA